VSGFNPRPWVEILVESQPDAGSTFSFEIDMEVVQTIAVKVNVQALSEQAQTHAIQEMPHLLAPMRDELDILHALALRVKYARCHAARDASALINSMLYCLDREGTNLVLRKTEPTTNQNC